MVSDPIRQLKADGVGIFLITHDIPDVFNLSGRLAVMKKGKLVGTYRTADVTEDEVLGMIIAGKRPEGTVEVRREPSVGMGSLRSNSPARHGVRGMAKHERGLVEVWDRHCGLSRQKQSRSRVIRVCP